MCSGSPMWAASLSLTAKQTDFQWPLRKIDLHLMELSGHNKLHLTQKTENSASGKAVWTGRNYCWRDGFQRPPACGLQHPSRKRPKALATRQFSAARNYREGGRAGLGGQLRRMFKAFHGSKHQLTGTLTPGHITIKGQDISHHLLLPENHQQQANGGVGNTNALEMRRN